jgi:hypothetical protein
MNEWMCIVYLLMALFFFWKGKKGNRQKSHQKAEIKDSQNSNMFLLKENLWSISIWASFFSPKRVSNYGFKFKLYCLSKGGLNPSNSLQKKVWNPFIWTIITLLLIQMVFQIRFLLKINFYFMGILGTLLYATWSWRRLLGIILFGFGKLHYRVKPEVVHFIRLADFHPHCMILKNEGLIYMSIITLGICPLTCQSSKFQRIDFFRYNHNHLK